MFKVCAVGCRNHHQPIKQILAEITSVELVAELVQILLQELRLYTMVHIGQQHLGVADGNVYPREYLANVLRVNDLRLVLREHILEMNVRAVDVSRAWL